MRDWNSPDEFPFGFDGGQKYLDDLLIVKPNHPEQLKSVRTFIKASFENLSCCLLPYPGKNVARNSNYDGRWSLMDEEFLNELKAAIPIILSPEYLITKKINNIELNGELANEYFQQFVGLYQAGSSVQPQSIYETTVEKFMMAIVTKCYDVYKNFANSGTGWIIDESGIINLYNMSRSTAFSTYDAEKKMGSNDHVAKYRNVLNDKMERDSIEWKAIALAGIITFRQELLRAEEAAKAEIEARQREWETAIQRAILHHQHEIAEQQRIEAERVAEAERARQNEQNRHKSRLRCSVM